MSRSIFGWDLPPGCTQRHIDEAAGGDSHSDAFYDEFFEAAEDIARSLNVMASDEVLLEKLADLAWKKIGDAYGDGYQQGQSDMRLAMDESQQ